MTAGNSRQHPRYAVEVAIELRAEDGPVLGRTSNLSKGGLCAVVARPIAAGTQLQLSVALVFQEGTLSEPLLLPARVVWCTTLGEERHQIGTAFLPLAQGQLDYMDMFLRYLEEGHAAQQAERPDVESDPGSEDADPFAP